MSERPSEQSGSSSASRPEQPQYGQYSDDRSRTDGARQPEYGQYGEASGASQSGDSGYGSSGYGSSDRSGYQQPGYGSGANGDGYSQLGYGSQNSPNQNYGDQNYSSHSYGQGYGVQPGTGEQGYSQQGGQGYPTHYQNDYTQQPYQQGYNGYQQGPVPGKGLGIASLVLGIVGMVTFWFFGLGAVFGLVGLVLGIVGLVKIRRSRRDSPALAIVGIVLSALALIGGVLMAGVMFWALGTVGDCMQYAEQGSQTQYQQCVNDKMGQDVSNT